MRYFNAKVGQGRVDDIVDQFGLGTGKASSDMLIQFYQEESLKITNTWYKLMRRRFYT